MVPAVMGVKNVNATFPEPVICNVSLPLFCKTSPEPIRPETEPPRVRPFVPQVTWILVILLVAVPEPNETVHVWLGFVGGVFTVTA